MADDAYDDEWPSQASVWVERLRSIRWRPDARSVGLLLLAFTAVDAVFSLLIIDFTVEQVRYSLGLSGPFLGSSQPRQAVGAVARLVSDAALVATAAGAAGMMARRWWGRRLAAGGEVVLALSALVQQVAFWSDRTPFGAARQTAQAVLDVLLPLVVAGVVLVSRFERAAPTEGDSGAIL